MQPTRQAARWLPKLVKDLSVRVNGYLGESPAHPPEPALEAETFVRYALQDALDRKASDIHLEPFSQGWRVRFRIDGYLHDVAQLRPADGQRTLRYLKTVAGLDAVRVFLPQDTSTSIEVLGTRLDLRLSFAPCHAGETLAIRILDPNRVQHRIEDLGLGSDEVQRLQEWLTQISGMCLVTGPTGSGKTTTLYALLHELVLSDNSIITVEDPVEYAIDGITQIQVDHFHNLDFARGLKAMLRLDPDFMLVGEMRDAESAGTAIEAAASGHVVLSTLHSPDAVGVITLLRSWGLPDHRIASVLEIVIDQRLVRRLCLKCRRQGPPTASEIQWLESLAMTPPPMSWREHGCPACGGTGYSGCIGVFEIWRRSETDYELILSNADEHTLRRHLRQRGLKTVVHDGLGKAREGITSLAEVQRMGTQSVLVGSHS